MPKPSSPSQSSPWLVQFLTGHNKLKRHKNIQNGVNDPHSCRLCLEEEKSSYHVIAECPATKSVRTKVFELNSLFLKIFLTLLNGLSIKLLDSEKNHQWAKCLTRTDLISIHDNCKSSRQQYDITYKLCNLTSTFIVQ